MYLQGSMPLAQSAEGIHPTSGKRYAPKPISDIANSLEAKALFGAATMIFEVLSESVEF